MYNFSLFKNKIRALIFLIVVWIFCIGVFFVVEKKTKLSEGVISGSINQSLFQNHQAIESKNSQIHLPTNNLPTFVKTHKLPAFISFVSFLHDKEGNSWGGTNSCGLWEQAKNSKFFIQNMQFPTSVSVSAIFEDLKHNLWVGNREPGVNAGLYEKKSGEVDFHCFRYDPAIPKKGNMIQMRFITQDKTGNMWAGTAHSGLWEKKVGSPYFENNGTFGLDWSWYTADIYFKDNSGNLWAGITDHGGGNGPFPNTGKGLWEKKGEKKGFQIESIPHNEDSTISNILQDKDGTMYVGLSYSRKPAVSGLFERKTEKDKFSLDSSFGVFPFWKPTSIFEDENDNLWIQSEDKLWEKPVNEKKFRENTIFSKTPTNLTHLFQDTLGNLWIGKDGSGLWEKQAGKNEKFKRNDSFPNMLIVYIYQKNDGSMFIKTVKSGWLSNSVLFKGFTVLSSTDKTSGYYYLDRHNKYVVVFNGGFDLKINSFKSRIIEKMTINNNEVKSSKGSVIHFPNASETVNNPIEVSVTYMNKSKATWSYLIKTQYNDDGIGGYSSVKNALQSIDGKGMKESYRQLTGDNKHIKYHLFSDLAVKNKNTNPTLKMIKENFNFLTDFANSSYVEININNGIISKIPTTKKSLEGHNGFCIITENLGSNNLYEVDLVDHVGNKQTFLIQEGGFKLNHNFKSNTNTWEYVMIGLGALVVILVLCGITYRLIYYPRKRGSTLFGIRNSNKNKTLNIKKIRTLELKAKAKKRKQTKKK